MNTLVQENEVTPEIEIVAEEPQPKKPQKKVYSKQVKRMIFYCCMIALPLLQFGIFYVGVNFNSILLAFSTHSGGEVGYKINYFAAGFNHFKDAFNYIISPEFGGGRVLLNSVIVVLVELCINLPLAIVFAFYIYKKFPLSKLFKVILFMPQLVSVMVFSVLYQKITQDVFAVVFNMPGGALGNVSSPIIRQVTAIFFTIWMSFGVNVVLFMGSMSSIDPSLVEAAQLDGANILQEFWHITLPMVWSTFGTFVVTTLSTIFVNQMNLYALYMDKALHEISTFGYLLFLAGQSAGLNVEGSGISLDFYELSALGLMFTAVSLPIVLTVRWLLNKFGPSSS